MRKHHPMRRPMLSCCTLLILLTASSCWCGRVRVDGFTAFARPRLMGVRQRNSSIHAGAGSSARNRIRQRSPNVLLQMAERGKGDHDNDNVLRRFTAPRIDDPGLPLSDVLVAQVIAPSLQIAWLSAAHAPQPSWLKPVLGANLLAHQH